MIFFLQPKFSVCVNSDVRKIAKGTRETAMIRKKKERGWELERN